MMALMIAEGINMTGEKSTDQVRNYGETIRDIYDMMYAKKGSLTSRKSFIKNKFLPMLKGEVDERKGEISLDTILANSKMQDSKDQILIEATQLLKEKAAMRGGLWGDKYSNSWLFPYLLEPVELIKDYKKKNLLYIELAHFFYKHSSDSDFNTGSCYDLMLEAYARVKPQNKEEQEQFKEALESDHVLELARHEFKFGSRPRASKAFELCGEQKRETLMEAMADSIYTKKKKGNKEKSDYESSAKENTGIKAVLKGEQDGQI